MDCLYKRTRNLEAWSKGILPDTYLFVRISWIKLNYCKYHTHSVTASQALVRALFNTYEWRNTYKAFECLMYQYCNFDCKKFRKSPFISLIIFCSHINWYVFKNDEIISSVRRAIARYAWKMICLLAYKIHLDFIL